MSIGSEQGSMIESEQSWFENNIISLLFPAKHCDAVSGRGKGGIFVLAYCILQLYYKYKVHRYRKPYVSFHLNMKGLDIHEISAA